MAQYWAGQTSQNNTHITRGPAKFDMEMIFGESDLLSRLTSQNIPHITH